MSKNNDNKYTDKPLGDVCVNDVVLMVLAYHSAGELYGLGVATAHRPVQSSFSLNPFDDAGLGCDSVETHCFLYQHLINVNGGFHTYDVYIDVKRRDTTGRPGRLS